MRTEDRGNFVWRGVLQCVHEAVPLDFMRELQVQWTGLQDHIVQLEQLREVVAPLVRKPGKLAISVDHWFAGTFVSD